MANLVQPIILCGGTGTRLWPLSRAGFPKQFIAISGEETLFQQTLKRFNGLDDLAHPIVIGNEEHRFLMMEQLREIDVNNASIILEPVARNTAPALTIAALAAIDKGDDPILLVTPADHVITDTVAFKRAVTLAISQAQQDAIVVLGISPTHPDTGYGYIRAGVQTEGAFIVDAFVEKPDEITAEGYIRAGNYFWNGGLFVLRASVWLEALKYYKPEMYKSLLKSWKSSKTGDFFIRPDRESFELAPSDSIDYAVIEKYPASGKPIRMIPLDSGWSDLGSWDAVWQSLPRDMDGNASVGDVIMKACHNVLVHASHKFVSAVGVDNITIVETADAVLVIDTKRSQEVREIVKELDTLDRAEHTLHRKVQRPWGWYDSVDEGRGFKVKRIMVKPGASLSLQKHAHRAEHWVVVSGVAEVVCGEKTLRLQQNESTYIPLGEIHRLSNPGDMELQIIEVQSGNYLGEDDIVRLEDQYNRHAS